MERPFQAEPEDLMSMSMSSRSNLLTNALALIVGSGSLALAATSVPYTWNHVAMGGGGFVAGILPHPTQKNLFYARTDVGGAYRWDETNQAWVQLMDWVPETQTGYLGVESFAVDPQNPAKFYALLGISYDQGGQTAIARSSNQGKTMALTTVSFKEDGNGMGRGSGEKLAVDPHKGNLLLCGTRFAGLYKSADSGATWNAASFPVTSTPNGNGISFVLFDTSGGTPGAATQRIWAGVSRKGSNNLYVSADAGTTWNPVSGAPTTYEPHRAVQAGSNLYVTYVDSSGPWNLGNGAIWKYNIPKGTWTEITPAAGNPYGGISVSPSDTNRILASTVNRYMSQPWGNGDRIFLSTNGGSSWTDLIGTNRVAMSTNGFPWIVNHAIHWAGSVVLDPNNPNRAFINSGNGIFSTTNLNATATSTWKFTVKGLEETVPLDLVSLSNGTLASAIGDYDGWMHKDVTVSPAAGGYAPSMGTTSTVAAAWNAPNVLVRSGKNLYGSTDTGVTWTQITSPAPGSSQGYLALSANGKALLWGVGNSVFRMTSVNNGWMSQGTSNGLSFNTHPVADGTNSSIFYAYNSGAGGFFTSTDGGATFTQTSTLSAGGNLHIRAAMGRSGDVWVALHGGGLKRSTNSGGTFNAITSLSSCQGVGFGKAAPGHSYPAVYIWGNVGGVSGVYRSDDTGTSWVRVNDDAHQFAGLGNGQFVMGDSKVYGRVYMSSAGLGIPYGEPAGNTSIAPDVSSAGLALSPHRVGMMISVEGLRTIRLLDLRGRMVRTSKTISGNEELDLAGLPRGIYVARCGRESLAIDVAR